jgi:hypothetical protein
MNLAILDLQSNFIFILTNYRYLKLGKITRVMQCITLGFEIQSGEVHSLGHLKLYETTY